VYVARIVDSQTGYFGGQLITLQSYVGKGANIKDFGAVSGGSCSSRSLCWPQGPKVVVEVVTETNVATLVSTLHTTSTRKDIQPIQTRTVIHKDIPVVNYIAEPDNHVKVQVVTETAKETVNQIEYETAVHTSTIVDIVVQVKSVP
jgi:hypothetical protein